ncbi:inositol phosphorylceramide glucuronosyltransferase 1 [Nicotiana attenuata]|uniref:Inositol phosphorylceramide glucuronosyltransferase 1 n=1 Tax=Nicotiana attenuata TaxID=49451 RepID=A0A314KYP6_NICAT|nr:inositol phosphorylceramide glucuronosyltransferase 1 [Nicotiana attenuata]
MKPILLRLWIISLIMFLSCNYWVIGASNSQSTEEAYVTLLYGDEFLLGVRVLGKSIRESGSTKDMVVLVSNGVSQYANDLLRSYSDL